VPFNAWIYSADVMIPVIGLGQKSAWQPAPAAPIQFELKLPNTLGCLEIPTNFVYYMQLLETVFGWVGGLLLVSFVTGLTKKE